MPTMMKTNKIDVDIGFLYLFDHRRPENVRVLMPTEEWNKLPIFHFDGGESVVQRDVDHLVIIL